MEERKGRSEQANEDLLDLYYEPDKNPWLRKNIFFQFRVLSILFSNPKRFFEKLGPFLFVRLVLIVTIIVIFLLLLPGR